MVLAMNSLSISYIVPMFNEEMYIEQCIKSILNNVSGCDEVIVVDNGSSDNSVSLVKKYNNVKLLYAPGVNVSCVRNIGAQSAKNEILAFIDADCKLDKSWKLHALDVLSEGKISVTGSKVFPSEDSSWIVEAWFSQRCSTPGDVKYINSGNLLVRKGVFFHVGGFNEHLVTGEDSEFCWRVRDAGYVVCNNPQIKSFHYGGPENLLAFYKQQRWHSLGMFGTFNVSLFDKPLIMTLVNTAFLIFSIMYSILCTKSYGLICFFNTFFLIFFVPLITVCYRVFVYKNYKQFFKLLILYEIYYLARSFTMLDILIRKLGLFGCKLMTGEKKTEKT